MTTAFMQKDFLEQPKFAWDTRYARYFANMPNQDLRAEAGNTITFDGVPNFLSCSINLIARTTAVDVVNGTGIVWSHAAGTGQTDIVWHLDEILENDTAQSVYRVEMITEQQAVAGVATMNPVVLGSRNPVANHITFVWSRYDGANRVRFQNRVAGVTTTNDVASGVLNITNPIWWEFVIRGRDMAVRYQANHSTFQDHGGGSVLGDFGADRTPAAVGAGSTEYAPDVYDWSFSPSSSGGGLAFTTHILGMRVQELLTS